MNKHTKKSHFYLLVFKFSFLILFPLISCMWYLNEAQHNATSLLFALVSSFSSIPLLFGVLLFLFHLINKSITIDFKPEMLIYLGFLAYVGVTLVDCIVAWSTLADLIAWILRTSEQHYGISELTNITNAIYSLYVISTTFLANAYIASFTKKSNQSTQQKVVRTIVPLRFK